MSTPLARKPSFATRSLLTVLSLLTGAWGGAPLPAQVVTLDEGAFRLSLDGAPAGREEFSIRRTGAGEAARVIARGTVELRRDGGRERIAVALEARGPRLEVTAYQVKVSGVRNAEIYVSRTARRFSMKLVSEEGEELREYPAGPGAIVLDEGVAHHYFLLGPLLGGDGGTVTALEPRTQRQLRLVAENRGTEEIQVAGFRVRARHLVLGTGPDERHVWLDEQDRVLRVEIPSLGYRADREALP